MACTSVSIHRKNSRDWLELPSELAASILVRLGAIHMLLTARKVCKSWRRICSEPFMWRVVNLSNADDIVFNVERVTRKAVDLSCGQLIEFNIDCFASDELLLYIADRSCQLRRLHLSSCHEITSEGFKEMVKKVPLLEELHIYDTPICKSAIEIVGHCCPQLKSFTLSTSIFTRPVWCDMYAIAIAENMPQVRHLQLSGNRITDFGLQAILENCPHVESLNIWLNVACLDHNLMRRLSHQIKNLRLSYISAKDNISEYEIYDWNSYNDDDCSGGNDISSRNHYKYGDYSGGRDINSFDYYDYGDCSGGCDIDSYNYCDYGDYSGGSDIDSPRSSYMDSD
ncbi:putative F-box/LRR-repeat protein 23 [Heracleum sosnowskyi]|uniref:F-box/LRR-repeat protein 23 n=1 Tax=Heracleum sosnowskyi TaxID=360622 RepID=A0AAD8IB78_9APIA|nr:putative F-box/LRR-repeat protein 23 [Heracleum sosnowskyi]